MIKKIFQCKKKRINYVGVPKKHYPYSWDTNTCEYYCKNKRYKEVELNINTREYKDLASAMQKGKSVKRITRVEAPYLYGFFLLAKAEYKSRNFTFNIKELYHDTAERNIDSILNENLDRRMACRVKFGRGVSFSPSTEYANCQSSRSNGHNRAMIVTDVLVGKTETCSSHGQQLPTNSNNDTTTGNSQNVFVKFYDNEFYPKYIIYYENCKALFANMLSVPLRKYYPTWDINCEYTTRDKHYKEFELSKYSRLYQDLKLQGVKKPTWDINCEYTTRDKHYKEFELSKYSRLYQDLKLQGVKKVKRITRVECPYLYGLFLLTKAEYESRGVTFSVTELFHDTAEDKIDSILNTNLDRRMASRVKFGSGVSFSPSTVYANKQSSRSNGRKRAMIVADVLIGNQEECDCYGQDLPSGDNDTTIGNSGKVYVKFYDNEFYPKYIMYYDNV
ncbi:poly [adp-ribose] polymerase [Holotrichia oblita]|uniref:Poly [adp-ribose] polymerase n=1 Tax=Holotrichia oblita TaxID=644536 RepID=A0ACB9SMI3_HOLOL|nr:poly [adp-ribose] polymerase [Holotrichia oblita]